MGTGESGYPKVHDSDLAANQRAGVLIHGSDGTNIQVIKVNSSGELVTSGSGGGGGGAVTFDITDKPLTHATVNVPDSTSTTLLAAATLVRRALIIQNISEYNLWINIDGAAANINQGILLEPSDVFLYDASDVYIHQGIITGYQDSGAAVDILVSYVES